MHGTPPWPIFADEGQKYNTSLIIMAESLHARRPFLPSLALSLPGCTILLTGSAQPQRQLLRVAAQKSVADQK